MVIGVILVIARMTLPVDQPCGKRTTKERGQNEMIVRKFSALYCRKENRADEWTHLDLRSLVYIDLCLCDFVVRLIVEPEN